MKKYLIAVILGLLSSVSPALANTNYPIAGVNCSVTAYTPYYANSNGLWTFESGISCGGSQAGLSKGVSSFAWALLNGQWTNIGYAQCGNFTFNPVHCYDYPLPRQPAGTWIKTFADGCVFINHGGSLDSYCAAGYSGAVQVTN